MVASDVASGAVASHHASVSESNRHGLKRNIPSRAAKAVREACGFGCVICGNAIYDYDHFDPPFAEATEHRPEGIALLCGNCHTKKSRGRLSPETVKNARLYPFCRREGFAWDQLDIGTRIPEIQIGTLTCHQVQTVIRMYGEDILTVRPPEAEGAPFRITALLRDLDGAPIFQVENNEVRINAGSYDVEMRGASCTIRRRPGEIMLKIIVTPRRSILIERIEMGYRGWIISGKIGADISIIRDHERNLVSGGMTVFGASAAIDISEAGVKVGLKAESVFIGNMVVNSALSNLRFPSDVLASTKKSRRNSPCFCGSGRRFKACHGNLE